MGLNKGVNLERDPDISCDATSWSDITRHLKVMLWIFCVFFGDLGATKTRVDWTLQLPVGTAFFLSCFQFGANQRAAAHVPVAVEFLIPRTFSGRCMPRGWLATRKTTDRRAWRFSLFIYIACPFIFHVVYRFLFHGDLCHNSTWKERCNERDFQNISHILLGLMLYISQAMATKLGISYATAMSRLDTQEFGNVKFTSRETFSLDSGTWLPSLKKQLASFFASNRTQFFHEILSIMQR